MLINVCSVAEVSIWIKNEGTEAYKPDVYGKEVLITRHFTIQGSSSYKIKSAGGKTISTRRDELNAITDHMGIQVGHPTTRLLVHANTNRGRSIIL